MDKNILYITFVDFNEQKSGSSVRPKKIYDTFLEEGYKLPFNWITNRMKKDGKMHFHI